MFIFHVILESLSSRNTRISMNNLTSEISSLLYVEPTAGLSGFQKEFNVRLRLLHEKSFLCVYMVHILYNVHARAHTHVHRLWIKKLQALQKWSTTLLFSSLPRTDHYFTHLVWYINPCTLFIYPFIFTHHILYAADSHRVLLKGEYPDYIHASFVNVCICSVFVTHMYIVFYVK